MTTETASVKIGSYTRQVTRAMKGLNEAIEAASRVAVSQSLDVLVKQDYAGRWQAFARRNTARGAAHEGDYDFNPATGRTAKRRDTKVTGGKLCLLAAAMEHVQVGQQIVNVDPLGLTNVELVDLLRGAE